MRTRSIKVYQKETFYSNVYECWKSQEYMIYNLTFKRRVSFLNAIRHAKKDFGRSQYRVEVK